MTLIDQIAAVLQQHSLWPQRERIAALVQAHKDAFIEQLLAECGLQAAADSAVVTHVRTLDDIGTIETVVRNHAAIIEKLAQEQHRATYEVST